MTASRTRDSFAACSVSLHLPFVDKDCSFGHGDETASTYQPKCAGETLRSTGLICATPNLVSHTPLKSNLCPRVLPQWSAY